MTLLNKLFVPVRLHVRRVIRLISPLDFITRRFIRNNRRDLGASSLCLDIGAGTSPFKHQLIDAFSICHYVSVDLTPSRELDLVCDARSLPLRSAVADLVVSFDVLQHLPDAEIALDEIARVLKPGGSALVVTPFAYGECDVRDYTRYTVDGILARLSARGLERDAVEKRGGGLFVFACFLTWRIQHLVPGQRRTWRSEKNLSDFARVGFVTLFTMPFHLLGWICLLLDSIAGYNKSGLYMGSIVLVTKTRPETTN